MWGIGWQNRLIYPVAGVALLVIAQALILHRLGLAWAGSFVDSGFFAMTVLTALTAFYFIFRYYQPPGDPLAAQIITALVLAGLFVYGFSLLLPAVFDLSPAHEELMGPSMPLRYFIACIILADASVTSWLWGALKERREHEKKIAESERLMREAELIRLRQQLQPHFLFNSLNSISALAVSQPEKAREMIQQLSGFLRGTLGQDDAPVKLSQEMEQVGLYLEIEKVRFGHRLTVETFIEEGCGELFLPPLIMQPLVENSIKHGLYGTTGQVPIRITAACQDKALVVSVKNPLTAGSAPSSPGTGFGLSSVRRRLTLIYGRSDLLATSHSGSDFITILKIPQKK